MEYLLQHLQTLSNVSISTFKLSVANVIFNLILNLKALVTPTLKIYSKV